MKKETLMRSAVLFFVSVSLIVLCGCAKNTDNAQNDEYILKIGKTIISPGKDAKAVLGALGEPLSYYEESAGCGSEERVREYEYGSFKIKTAILGGNEMIDTVTVTDDSICTPSGITVGSRRADVVSAYGDDFYEYPNGIAYKSGRTTINFSIREDRVILIYYDYEF